MTIIEDIDLLMIRWIDTTSYEAWRDLDEVKELTTSICWAVGWLLYETKSFITIGSMINWDTQDFSSIHVIPKKAIITRYVLDITELMEGG